MGFGCLILIRHDDLKRLERLGLGCGCLQSKGRYLVEFLAREFGIYESLSQQKLFKLDQESTNK